MEDFQTYLEEAAKLSSYQLILDLHKVCRGTILRLSCSLNHFGHCLQSSEKKASLTTRLGL